MKYLFYNTVIKILEIRNIHSILYNTEARIWERCLTLIHRKNIPETQNIYLVTFNILHRYTENITWKMEIFILE